MPEWFDDTLPENSDFSLLPDGVRLFCEKTSERIHRAPGLPGLEGKPTRYHWYQQGLRDAIRWAVYQAAVAGKQKPKDKTFQV